jgi:lipopolysaccharide transport system ATP-binding protein
MQMRLAFAVATSVDADVLLIDEALSVGDGAFARKSFDRMMEVKQKGTSVLFCSHVLFHVEVFCDRVLWLDRGEIRAIGPPKTVLGQYQEYLDDLSGERSAGDSNLAELQTRAQSHHLADDGGQAGPMRGHARIVSVEVEVDGNTGTQLQGFSGRSLMRMRIIFKSDPLIPAPSAAIVFSSQGGRIIGTNLSVNQAVDVPRDQEGSGVLTIEIEPLRLNKGTFRVGAYLLCEKGIHVYQWIDPVATIDMHRDTYDQGYWMVEGQWHSDHRDT